jgi:hypothetical protein
MILLRFFRPFLIWNSVVVPARRAYPSIYIQYKASYIFSHSLFVHWYRITKQGSFSFIFFNSYGFFHNFFIIIFLKKKLAPPFPFLFPYRASCNSPNFIFFTLIFYLFFLLNHNGKLCFYTHLDIILNIKKLK